MKSTITLQDAVAWTINHVKTLSEDRYTTRRTTDIIDRTLKDLAGPKFRNGEITDWSIWVELEESFGVSGTTQLSFEYDHEASRGTSWHIRTVKTNISWSSTGRSVSAATACVNLYQKLIAVAASFEAHFEGSLIVDDVV